MKKLFMILPLVFLLCFAFSCQQTEVSALSDEDMAAIKATAETFSLAVSSEDFTALAELFTEEAVLMPPNLPRIQGKEAVQAWFEANPPTTEILTIEEIVGCGDLAFVCGTYSQTIALEGVPSPVHNIGKYIEIRRKQEDGSWLIARAIFNSDLPLPPPPEKK